MLQENRVLEQEISSVKELSVSVARWLVQGSAVEICPLSRQAQPNSEVRACGEGASYSYITLISLTLEA